MHEGVECLRRSDMDGQSVQAGAARSNKMWSPIIERRHVGATRDIVDAEHSLLLVLMSRTQQSLSLRRHRNTRMDILNCVRLAVTTCAGPSR